jgi:nucleotide-binding universal stress UspA family protein
MEGDLIENIKKVLVEDKIDFVVMGTAGVTDWDAVFVGSNSGMSLLG